MTGTYTGITKVCAEQTFDGCFADYSPVQAHLVTSSWTEHGRVGA